MDEQNPNQAEIDLIAQFELNPVEAWHASRLASLLGAEQIQEAAAYAFACGYTRQHKTWQAAEAYLDKQQTELKNQLTEFASDLIGDLRAAMRKAREMRSNPDTDPEA